MHGKFIHYQNIYLYEGTLSIFALFYTESNHGPNARANLGGHEGKNPPFGLG